MSRSPRSTHGRLVLTLAALTVLSSACVKPDDPGVAVKPIKAEIVFGVKEPEKPAAPANSDPDSDIEVAPEEVPIPEPLLPPEIKGRTTTTRATKAALPCPPVNRNVFAEVESPTNVPFGRKPDVGIYRWKKEGFVQIDDPATSAVPAVTTPPTTTPNPNNPPRISPDTTLVDPNNPPEPPRPASRKVAVTGFENRLVRNVVVIKQDPKSPHPNPQSAAAGATVPEMIFTYETLQPELGSKDFVVTKYKIDTANYTARASNPAGAEEVTAGDAERGLVLKSLSRVDSANQPVGDSFNTGDGGGLLLAPLELSIGERWVSVATDNGRGRQTLRLEAQVVGRDDVDMCGTPISTFKIAGTLTYSQTLVTQANPEDPQPRPIVRNWEYYVAPHFGGLIVQEHIVEVNEQTSAQPRITTDVVFTQGQTKPTTS